MDSLTTLPEEYLQPLLPCFDLLKNCNVLFFDDRAFFRRVLPYLYILPSVAAYHVALTIYLMEGFKRSMDLDELVYVVPVYMVTLQSEFSFRIKSDALNYTVVFISLFNINYNSAKIHSYQ